MLAFFAAHMLMIILLCPWYSSTLASDLFQVYIPFKEFGSGCFCMLPDASPSLLNLEITKI